MTESECSMYMEWLGGDACATSLILADAGLDAVSGVIDMYARLRYCRLNRCTTDYVTHVLAMAGKHDASCAVTLDVLYIFNCSDSIYAKMHAEAYTKSERMRSESEIDLELPFLHEFRF